jgi:hypothetical protein
MKYFIPVFLLLFAVSARAQITLEHTYSNTSDFGIVEVESGVWKYVSYNENDSIDIFNLDHSLDRVLIVPNNQSGNHIALIAKGVFDTNNTYAYMVSFYSGNTGYSGYRVYDESSHLLFSCDSCFWEPILMRM